MGTIGMGIIGGGGDAFRRSRSLAFLALSYIYQQSLHWHDLMECQCTHRCLTESLRFLSERSTLLSHLARLLPFEVSEREG
jgi:hypothetical protein